MYVSLVLPIFLQTTIFCTAYVFALKSLSHHFIIHTELYHLSNQSYRQTQLRLKFPDMKFSFDLFALSMVCEAQESQYSGPSPRVLPSHHVPVSYET
ncbi:hypothetical protein Y032_0007g3171 [Ancylostoma ceylanicum]|uniref:Uncharacterized protein n=1 Tax=Ancylostoma ceylanicum TaxID=53326 RepID=A0A016VMS1_9BILA|nr:hypothetical protein Y032_0007g3171 [Ancylostoma ceylanicum]